LQKIVLNAIAIELLFTGWNCRVTNSHCWRSFW